MRRIPLSIEAKKVLNMLVYTLFGLLIATSTAFFIKTSSTAERGYSLKENQLLQKELEAENRLLKQQLLEAQSITELEKSDFIEEMEQPKDKKYIEPRGPISRK